MSPAGLCPDHAMMDRFIVTLNKEPVPEEPSMPPDHAKVAMPEDFDGFLKWVTKTQFNGPAQPHSARHGRSSNPAARLLFAGISTMKEV